MIGRVSTQDEVRGRIDPGMARPPAKKVTAATGCIHRRGHPGVKQQGESAGSWPADSPVAYPPCGRTLNFSDVAGSNVKPRRLQSTSPTVPLPITSARRR